MEVYLAKIIENDEAPKYQLVRAESRDEAAAKLDEELKYFGAVRGTYRGWIVDDIE